MTQLTRNPNQIGGHRYGTASPRPLVVPTTESTHLRFRNGQFIAWSFAPISPEREPNELLTRQSRSTALFIWLHSKSTDMDPEAASVAQVCNTNWLHVLVDDDVSTRSIGMPSILDEIRDVISMLCEAYSIDRSRTYLAAQGAGTDAALRLLLMHPSLCHGIAMFNPRLTYMPEMIESDDRREPVRALLVHTVQRDAPIREMFAFGRLLHAARMRLTTHFCLPNRIPWGRLLEDWFAKDQAEEPAWCCHW